MIGSIALALDRRLSGPKRIAEEARSWPLVGRPWSWSLDRYARLDGGFRTAYELQSRASTVVMAMILISLGPGFAISVNIVWAIVVAVLYPKLIASGRQDLMALPPEEKGANSWVSRFIMLQLNGVLETFVCWFHARAYDSAGNSFIAGTVSKPIALSGACLFGVTPGHHLLSKEFPSSRATQLNAAARVPNAFVKWVQVTIYLFVGFSAWSTFQLLWLQAFGGEFPIG